MVLLLNSALILFTTRCSSNIFTRYNGGDLLTLKSSGEASISALKNAAKRAVVEAVAPIRDNPLVADLLMTRVDAWVAFAKNKFKENIVLSKKKENQLSIKLIQVPVFGG